MSFLDLEDSNAFDCLTEGGSDFGVDAMQMGRKLLNDMGIKSEKDINHQNFRQGLKLVEQNGSDYLNSSVENVEKALQALYGVQEISLQQLSATFRRGDLIDRL